jgi:hypothetical protein
VKVARRAPTGCGHAEAAARMSQSDHLTSPQNPSRPAAVSPVPTGVFVLGMHRAGTSAVARATHLLGVPTAAAEHLKDPSPVNPEGFWEIKALTEINDKLLQQPGWHWSTPPAPGEMDWAGDERVQGLRDRARRGIAELLPGERWIWKDPRNCITLPFWRQALDVVPVVILIHRDPLEVAGSLTRRDGFSKALGLSLWERYARSALSAAEGLPTLVVSYAQLLGSPDASTTILGDFLVDNGLEVGDAGREAAVDSLRPDLRRVAVDPQQLDTDPDVTDVQRRVAEAFTELEGAHEALAAPDLPPESARTALVLHERRAGRLSLRERNQRLHQRNNELQRQLEDTRTKLDETRVSKAGLRRKVKLMRDRPRYLPIPKDMGEPDA